MGEQESPIVERQNGVALEEPYYVLTADQEVEDREIYTLYLI